MEDDVADVLAQRRRNDVQRRVGKLLDVGDAGCGSVAVHAGTIALRRRPRQSGTWRIERREEDAMAEKLTGDARRAALAELGGWSEVEGRDANKRRETDETPGGKKVASTVYSRWSPHPSKKKKHN